MNSSTDNENEVASRRTDFVWIAACSLITAVATFLRFYWLELKPLHHDEGVNGWFLTNLFRDGVYKYDPSNYHGPTLYYISLAFSKTFGLNTWSVRSSVAGPCTSRRRLAMPAFRIGSSRRQSIIPSGGRPATPRTS